MNQSSNISYNYKLALEVTQGLFCRTGPRICSDITIFFNNGYKIRLHLSEDRVRPIITNLQTPLKKFS